MTSYNGSTYTWQGRELRKITSGSNTYSYKYNADGIRTSKTVNGTKTEFFLNGSQILAQKTGDTTMLFFYDSAGKRVGFANGDTLYYYLYNVQGDVIAIMRAATGQIVAKYSYDAWGKCTVTNATGYTVGEKNPFRYRGYYYDTETGLYYLNSRYYSPEFGRFISADSFVSTGQGTTGGNMFAYCGNNPVNRFDPDGDVFLGIALWKIGIAFAASLGLFVGAKSIIDNPPALPPITLPKFEFKSKAAEKSKDSEKSNSPALPRKSKDPIHHIVAKADSRAAESRQILRDVGIEPVTDLRNLVPLPAKYHASLHTTAYHNYVTERLRPVAGDRVGVEMVLASLKAEIVARSAIGIRWD